MFSFFFFFISDFGFSQFLSLEERQNTFRGSPLYMAPEMLIYQDYDARVDLWSVGVIMYECLFGKAPYSSSNVQELAEKINTQKSIEVYPFKGIETYRNRLYDSFSSIFFSDSSKPWNFI